MEWVLALVVFGAAVWVIARSRSGGVDPRAFIWVFWRCPLCRAEETLSVRPEGLISRRFSVECTACRARWQALTRDGMTLVAGPSEHLGRRPLDEWARLGSGPVVVKPLEGVSVPVVMMRGEVPIKVGYAHSYRERTRRVRSGGSYTGVSIRVAKGVRLSTGSISRGASHSVTETVSDDRGEFVLTNQRLVFNGNKRAINMDVKKIVAVDVEDGFLEVGYGTRTHRFTLGDESPYKWEAYIRGVAEWALGSRAEEAPGGRG